MLREVNPPGRWKHLVVDSGALDLLNSCCKMSDILAENVTVEGLLNRRQKVNKEAIYFITSTLTSINALLDDYSDRPTYIGAHIYFVSSLSDASFEKINRSSVRPYIRAFKELNIDFIACDSQSFSLEKPESWFPIYNPEAPSLLSYELGNIAKGIVSVMATIGEYPHVRYYSKSSMFSTSAQKSITSELSDMVQKELDSLCKSNPEYPSSSQYERAILIIIDRSMDVLAPILHDFAYQPMIADLIQLRSGKFKDENGKDVALDDSDQIWEKVKSWHIAKVLEYLPEELKKFTSENLAARYEIQGQQEGSSAAKLDSLKGAVSSMGEYTDMKNKLSKHTDLCTRLMNMYSARNLEKVSSVEQNLVMTDPSSSKSYLEEVIEVLEDSSIDRLDKIRVLFLYVVSREGVSDRERQKLFDAVRIRREESQALTNLSVLNVRLSSSMEKNKSKNPFGLSSNVQRSAGKYFEFENSKYIPTVKYILEDQINNSLDANWFPWVKEPPYNNSSVGGSSGRDAPDQRKKRTWASKKSRSQPNRESDPQIRDRRTNGPRIILFCVGGISHNEIVAINRLAAEKDRDVIIGSTHLWEPDLFIEAMKVLNKNGATASSFLDFKRPIIEARTQSSRRPSLKDEDREYRRRGSDDTRNRGYREDESRNRGYREDDTRNRGYREEESRSRRYREEESRSRGYREEDSRNRKYKDEDIRRSPRGRNYTEDDTTKSNENSRYRSSRDDSSARLSQRKNSTGSGDIPTRSNESIGYGMQKMKLKDKDQDKKQSASEAKPKKRWFGF